MKGVIGSVGSGACSSEGGGGGVRLHAERARATNVCEGVSTAALTLGGLAERWWS
jgi:hypothetical protein